MHECMMTPYVNLFFVSEKAQSTLLFIPPLESSIRIFFVDLWVTNFSFLFAVNDLRRLIEKAGGKLDHSLYAQSATHVGSLSREVSKNLANATINTDSKEESMTRKWRF